MVTREEQIIGFREALPISLGLAERLHREGHLERLIKKLRIALHPDHNKRDYQLFTDVTADLNRNLEGIKPELYGELIEGAKEYDPGSMKSELDSVKRDLGLAVNTLNQLLEEKKGSGSGLSDRLNNYISILGACGAYFNIINSGRENNATYFWDETTTPIFPEYVTILKENLNRIDGMKDDNDIVIKELIKFSRKIFNHIKEHEVRLLEKRCKEYEEKREKSRLNDNDRLAIERYRLTAKEWGI